MTIGCKARYILDPLAPMHAHRAMATDSRPHAPGTRTGHGVGIATASFTGGNGIDLRLETSVDTRADDAGRRSLPQEDASGKPRRDAASSSAVSRFAREEFLKSGGPPRQDREHDGSEA
jgi:hypothetical protein